MFIEEVKKLLGIKESFQLSYATGNLDFLRGDNSIFINYKYLSNRDLKKFYNTISERERKDIVRFLGRTVFSYDNIIYILLYSISLCLYDQNQLKNFNNGIVKTSVKKLLEDKFDKKKLHDYIISYCVIGEKVDYPRLFALFKDYIKIFPKQTHSFKYKDRPIHCTGLKATILDKYVMYFSNIHLDTGNMFGAINFFDKKHITEINGDEI